jgi:hypothetical protein
VLQPHQKTGREHLDCDLLDRHPLPGLLIFCDHGLFCGTAA